jgi:hypothetical protein
MPLTNYEQLPLDAQRRLDAACVRFERAWAESSEPDLAEYLAAAPALERTTWLTELLHIEADYRRQNGETPTADDYRARFPEKVAAVDAVFGETPEVGVGSMVGKYRLLRVLGRGGTGIVYEAEDPVIGRRAAVKVLSGRVGSDRVIEEARLAGPLQHPNIVTVYDAGEFGGVWYLALELLAASAADRIKEVGPFSPAVATRIAADVCRGLVVAHAAGLVHRDIKPANILLTAVGETTTGQPTAKLSDFGLARDDGPADAPVRSVFGTPAYMSPGQFVGQPTNPASDVYSLGATYFALLTGRPPYPAATSAEAIDAHCNAPVPDPRRICPELPPGCARIVTRAMAKARAVRYPDAAAMLADLEGLLARRISGRRRRPALAAVVGGVALLTAFGSAGFAWRAHHSATTEPAPGAASATSVDIRDDTNAPCVALFNGRDLSGWQVFFENHEVGDDPQRQFTVVTRDGEPAIRVTGGLPGTITTEGEYEDYHLRLEYCSPKGEKDRNSGILYHAVGGHGAGVLGAMWVHEFEMMPRNIGGYHRFGSHRSIDLAELRDGQVVPLRAASATEYVRSDREYEPGRWNVLELICWRDSAVHLVNGAVVMTLGRSRYPTPNGEVPLTRGRIQLQACRGDFYFRRIEIRPVSSIAAAISLSQAQRQQR